MTNRLNSGGDKKPKKRTAQEWCDRGNALLAGQIPCEHGKLAGTYIPRNDVEWVVKDGHSIIQWKLGS